MKLIYTLLLLLGLFSAKTQIVLVESDDERFEPGKWYFSLLEDSEDMKEESFVLEATPNEYEEVEVQYTEQELAEHRTEYGRYQFQTMEPHTSLVIKNSATSKCISNENSTGYIFGRVEIPAKYLSFSKEELSAKNNRIIIKRITKNSKLLKTNVKNKPSSLKEDTYFFESGNWSAFKRVHCADKVTGYTVRAIQQKLIALGYDLVEDNVMGTKTKKAMLDFQRKHGLPEGNLDFQTLEALGVKH